MDHHIKEAAQNSREWQVSMPEDDALSVSDENKAAAGAGPALRAWLASRAAAFRSRASGLAGLVWKMIGTADYPGKAVYGMKVALALALVSLFYYARPLYDGVGRRNVVWAIMTVVLVFEYTVGGSMYKGFNRTVGTISGAGLALGVHWVASKSGKTLEPVVGGGSVLLLAAAAFSRFIPMVKSLYDYGVTVFIITYSFVAVSGYRVEDLAALALQRISTITVGFVICIAVCVLVFPVWSGQELRLLTTRNMEALADSIQACVDDYFAEDDDAKRAARDCRSEGYKRVLGSKASEDAHADLARWEPAHGKFGFRHPYEIYTKVGAAMRQCAYCVEALDSRVLAATPTEQGPHLLPGAGRAFTEVSAGCARVLREASRSIATMTASGALGAAVADMDEAVRALQSDMRSLPSKLLLLADDQADTSLIEASMALLPMALLLIEIASRIKGVVDAVATLASVAGFEQGEYGKVETEMEVSPA